MLSAKAVTNDDHELVTLAVIVGTTAATHCSYNRSGLLYILIKMEKNILPIKIQGERKREIEE